MTECDNFWQTVNGTGCFSYIQIEHARVAAVAALAKEHAELRVENCVALGVSECVFAASRALALFSRKGF